MKINIELMKDNSHLETLPFTCDTLPAKESFFQYDEKNFVIIGTRYVAEDGFLCPIVTGSLFHKGDEISAHINNYHFSQPNGGDL